jgi:hypothetical protein
MERAAHQRGEAGKVRAGRETSAPAAELGVGPTSEGLSSESMLVVITVLCLSDLLVTIYYLPLFSLIEKLN